MQALLPYPIKTTFVDGQYMTVFFDFLDWQIYIYTFDQILTQNITKIIYNNIRNFIN